MTYRQLEQQCKEIPEGHKDDDVTIYIEVEDEFYKVFSDTLAYCSEDTDDNDNDVAGGILDGGHPYLILSDVS